jgi:CheY-like chemotaxis protein
MNDAVELRDLEPVDILLVEDNPADAELTLRVLHRKRLVNRVDHVTDGAQAIEYLLGDPDRALPKLVLLDLKLPKVDGFEVLKRIRADSRTRHLPVVVLTSSTEERDLVDGYELGANSFVSKPVNFDEFQDAVEHVGLYWMLLNRVPGGSPTTGSTAFLRRSASS